MTAMIDLDHVQKSFGDFHALHGLSLQIEEGEFVSLLGPSGCGKTTSLRIVAGFESPTAGDVRIDGRSVLGLRADKRGVGIVFQNYALFPHMNVADNVAFGLRARRERGEEVRRRVEEMLELMEMQQFASRRVHELSGGQQQRVALARALAIRPRVLLLDEPLGALDKKLREQMQIVLMDLHRQLGMTMVYVTHDQEEALSMSHRVAVMRQGDLVQYDTPDGLYYTPNSLYVCQFVGRTNVFDDTVDSVDRGVVRTRHGLVATTLAQVRSGDRCAVCVRPERLTLLADDAAPNVLRGVVLERIFLGQTTNYVVELESGGRAEASLFSDAGGAAAAPGDRVTVGFEPEHAHVFATDRAASAAEPLAAVAA